MVHLKAELMFDAVLADPRLASLLERDGPYELWLKAAFRPLLGGR